MILVTLSITVPPGRREEMVDAFGSLLGPVRVAPGCLACELYQEVGYGEVLLYMEEWETPEQLEHHLRSVRYERLLAIMEASAQPPVLRYLSIAAVNGLEYLETVRLGAGAAPPLAPAKPIKEMTLQSPGREANAQPCDS
ncbi:MAG TPA: antibiotic biosynthesis monooxygenase family protein [Gemmataceae bacterium]|nr:antibiotic biosynthesis monooxygenase family protein [Gemmataceae bacterium]